MPTTKGANEIEYTEIPNYTEGWRSTDNSQAVRILECGWNNRYRFVQDLLGWSDYDSGSIITRYIPEQHPDPDLDTFYAVEAQLIGGVGVPDIDDDDFIRFLDKVPTDPIPAQLVYGRARYQVTYRQFDYDIFADEDIATELERYVSRYYNFSIESVTLPGNTFEFTSDSQKIPELAPIVFPLVELTYVWRQVPDPYPSATITAALGKVNNAAFDVNFSPTVYVAESLLLIGADVKSYWSVGGRFSWDITYKFSYRPNTWNKLYRKSTNSFDAIRRVAAPSQSAYLTTSFDALFTPTA